MKALWGRDEVKLFDGELSRRKEANRKYMMSLTRENLMRNYMLEAGRYTAPNLPNDIHGGWESPTCQLRGHFTGHWLSAAALHYHATGDEEVRARAEAMVEELACCQTDNGGEWAASIPEKYLHWIARGKAVWAPQYTVHKTFMGLTDMALYANSRKALEVAESFAKWFLRWSDGFTREEFDDILDVETGGMLEIWVRLYDITGNEIYEKLIDKYYRGRLFDSLLEGRDVLTNMHANTTIPEILGCALAYDVTGKKKWREIVEAYWNCAVTIRGQYATGGQTCGEIWTPTQQLDKRLGDKNQEYCTVYNMMRLAEFMFRWTGDAKYADYWEQNLYNGIMAQSYWQGSHTNGVDYDTPDKGLLTYFLPMEPGARKGWASETQDFFCCHGTLVQSNAILNRGIYYQDGDSLYVCQYFDSEARVKIDNQLVKLTQKRDSLSGSFHMESTSDGRQTISDNTAKYPAQPDLHVACFEIAVSEKTNMRLLLRVPYWIKGDATLLINNETIDFNINPTGFISIERLWQNGDNIRLVLPQAVTLCPIPGNKNMAAFQYGPLTLAGLCDGARTLTMSEERKDLLVHDNEREWGSWKNTFRATGQENNIRFVPIKDIGYKPYTIYFSTRNE